MNIPAWAKVAIMVAWAALKAALSAAGFPSVVISAIEAVLQHFGILGAASFSSAELHARADALKDHCSGVACAPDLKS